MDHCCNCDWNGNRVDNSEESQNDSHAPACIILQRDGRRCGSTHLDDGVSACKSGTYCQKRYGQWSCAGYPPWTHDRDRFMGRKYDRIRQARRMDRRSEGKSHEICESHHFSCVDRFHCIYNDTRCSVKFRANSIYIYNVCCSSSLRCSFCNAYRRC